MQVIMLWKICHHQEILVSAAQVHIAINQWPRGRNVGKVPLNSIRNSLEVLTVFQFMPTMYQDHENFGKSTTIFIPTFIKTLVILRVNKHFWGKFCESVLFNNCFPFNRKIPVKCSTVLLVVNKVAEIPWFCRYLKDVF